MVSRCGAVGINNNNNQPPPPAMITLDLWLPPSHVLDSWDVLDSGQLGPAARLSFIHHHHCNDHDQVVFPLYYLEVFTLGWLLIEFLLRVWSAGGAFFFFNVVTIFYHHQYQYYIYNIHHHYTHYL